MRLPDFDELVGTELDPAERERLRRVHDLLVTVGPPPELPARLEQPGVRAFPRRRALLLLAATVAVAAAAFGAGWFTRGGEDSFAVRLSVPMHGTTDAPRASGLLKIGFPDERGNWQMLVTVSGLRPLPEGGYYHLMLTRNGKPLAECGTFNVSGRGKTTILLGASYRLKNFDGWAVQPWLKPNDVRNDLIVLKT
jgi:hypothetical protein